MSLGTGLCVSVLILAGGCHSAMSSGQAVQATDTQITIHYYINSDNAVMEFWVDEDSAVVVDTTIWDEVSLDSLHALGLYSPTENMATAIDNGTAGQEGTTLGGNYRSYITCRYVSGSWQVTLGSETWRSGGPGWCLVYGESREDNNPPYFTAWRLQYWWKAYVQAPPKYVTQSHLFDQQGRHAFNPEGDPTFYSHVWGYYP